MVTPSRVAVLALLCAADLLVMLDGMVVTVALPAIERGLGTARADLQWVVTAATCPWSCPGSSSPASASPARSCR
jgi:NaMN:DMB phosphoribosyltransferase